MTSFYEFLKNQSDKSSGFDVFSEKIKDTNSYSLTQAQLIAFETKNSTEISRQLVLEQDDLPRNAAISITIPITITFESPV